MPDMLAALNTTCHSITGRYIPGSSYLEIALPATVDHPGDVFKLRFTSWGRDLPPISYKYEASELVEFLAVHLGLTAAHVGVQVDADVNTDADVETRTWRVEVDADAAPFLSMHVAPIWAGTLKAAW